ncbi:MAG: hypothetical protein M3Z37_09945 [Candidatus Eremiobacteraeota bacterium]|nr:hypothetical protein [Candidatus Eremiobacteraeota bacterium]
MRKLRIGLATLASVGVLVGCTTNTGVGTITTPPNVLQLAVGSLNDAFGTLTGTAGVYLNAVTTFRNNLGNSAFINPGTATMTTPTAGTLNACGLFGYGQNPSALTAGTPTAGYPSTLVFGLPPAYPNPSLAQGYSLGFLYWFQSDCATFQAPPAPAAGSYTVSTSVLVNGAQQAYSATATMATVTTLGAESAPVFTPSGGGAGTFTITKPAGVTESLIIIVAGSGEAATLSTTTTSATMPAGTLAPGSYTAFVIAADYPLLEAGPPASQSQSPTLTGANGSADLTVSGSGASFTI